MYIQKMIEDAINLGRQKFNIYLLWHDFYFCIIITILYPHMYECMYNKNDNDTYVHKTYTVL